MNLSITKVPRAAIKVTLGVRESVVVKLSFMVHLYGAFLLSALIAPARQIVSGRG